jgi:hypothetical protein
LLLKSEEYIPWFKEIILPLDEEGIMIFAGETSDSDSNLSES